jgi:hypothetical protein
MRRISSQDVCFGVRVTPKNLGKLVEQVSPSGFTWLRVYKNGVFVASVRFRNDGLEATYFLNVFRLMKKCHSPFSYLYMYPIVKPG